jgi:hypothetical protein
LSKLPLVAGLGEAAAGGAGLVPLQCYIGMEESIEDRKETIFLSTVTPVVTPKFSAAHLSVFIDG